MLSPTVYMCLRRASCASLVFCLLTTVPVALPQTASLKITVLDGQGAINNIRQRRAREPVVQVTDDNLPLKDVTVTFVVPDTGPGGVFGESARMLVVQTDEKGQATGRGLHPNSVSGRFEIRVTASYKGQSVSTAIAQTNAEPAGAASGAGGGKKFLWIALLGGGVAAGAAVALGGKSSSSPQGGGITNPTGTVLTPGAPVIQGPH